MADEDSKYISDSMIKKYNQHKEDLKLLKSYIKEYHPNDFNRFFRGKNSIYEMYIKSPKKMPWDELKIKINSVLTNDDNITAKNIKDSLEKESFLPKINSKENGSIPYQLHQKELEAIIDNQGVYYDVLKNNKELIVSIMNSRIPYYVGPLTNDKNNKFAWLTRLDDSNKKAIKPWNIYELVDIEQTAKDFINRSRNHCTYLLSEETLPKNSILYKEYEVYNELNRVRINDHLINETTKEDIINNLFKKKNVVKIQDVQKYLIDSQIVKEGQCQITGAMGNGCFLSNMTSYIYFEKLLGKEVLNNKINEVEKIIEILTVYKDKKIIRTVLSKDEFSFLNNDQIKALCNKQFAGYSRLSKKLLVGLISSNLNGECYSIMDLLKTTNKNFMQILFNEKYGFAEMINYENYSETNKIEYENIEELAGSPALKRGIWQGIKVVREISSYMGHNPSNIYIEFAREEGEKKRTLSRAKQLEKKYKDYLDGEVSDGERIRIANLSNQIKEKEKEISFNEKLYLYYLQQGKCLYSGEALDINEFENYEIDHIIPRCYTTDNSIDNKALVKRIQNQRKADNLLLDSSIINKQRAWWERLKKSGLISSKKYDNLCKTTISDKEKIGFINRQLVETRQISKNLVDLLKIDLQIQKLNLYTRH